MGKTAITILWWTIPFRWIFWFSSIFASIVGAFEVAETFLMIDVFFDKFQRVPIAFLCSGIGVVFLTNDKIINQHKNNKNIDYLAAEISKLKSVLTPSQLSRLDEIEITTEKLSDYGINIDPSYEFKLGNIARIAGRNEDAKRHYEKSYFVFSEKNNTAGKAEALNGLGKIERTYGDFSKARNLHIESRDLWLQSGNKLDSARAINNIAMIESHEGDLVEAKRLYEECLTIFREFGNREKESMTLGNLGDLAIKQDQLDEAYRLTLESQEIRKNLGLPLHSTLHSLGKIEMLKGRIDDAEQLFLQSLKDSKKLGISRIEAMSLFELGNVSNHRGRHSKSIQFYNDSLAIFEKMGDKKRRLEVLEKLNMIIDDEKSEN